MELLWGRCLLREREALLIYFPLTAFSQSVRELVTLQSQTWSLTSADDCSLLTCTESHLASNSSWIFLAHCDSPCACTLSSGANLRLHTCRTFLNICRDKVWINKEELDIFLCTASEHWSRVRCQSGPDFREDKRRQQQAHFTIVLQHWHTV